MGWSGERGLGGGGRRWRRRRGRRGTEVLVKKQQPKAAYKLRNRFYREDPDLSAYCESMLIQNYKDSMCDPIDSEWRFNA